MMEREEARNLSIDVCHVCGSKLHRDLISGKEWCRNTNCQVYDVRFTVPTMETLTHPVISWLLSGRIARDAGPQQKDNLHDLLARSLDGSQDAILSYLVYTGGVPIPVDDIKEHVRGNGTPLTEKTLSRMVVETCNVISRELKGVHIPEKLTAFPSIK